jgi:hypothetical protein
LLPEKLEIVKKRRSRGSLKDSVPKFNSISALPEIRVSATKRFWLFLLGAIQTI